MNVLYHRGGGVSILNKFLLSALRCNEEYERRRLFNDSRSFSFSWRWIWDGVILDKIGQLRCLPFCEVNKFHTPSFHRRSGWMIPVSYLIVGNDFTTSTSQTEAIISETNIQLRRVLELLVGDCEVTEGQSATADVNDLASRVRGGIGPDHSPCARPDLKAFMLSLVNQRVPLGPMIHC